MADYSGFDVWHESVPMIMDNEVHDAITHNLRIQPTFDNTRWLRSRLLAGVTRIYPVASLAALRTEPAGAGDVRLVLGDGLYYADTDTATADDGYFAIRSSVRADLLWRFSSGFRINTPGGFVVLSTDGKIPPVLLPGYTASRIAIVDMVTAGKLSDTISPGAVRELVRGSYSLTGVLEGDACSVRSKTLMVTNYSAYAPAYLALFYSLNGGSNVLMETLTIPFGSTPFPVFAGFDSTVSAPGAGALRFSIQAASAPDANLSITAISDSASMGTIQMVREVAQ